MSEDEYDVLMAQWQAARENMNAAAARLAWEQREYRRIDRELSRAFQTKFPTKEPTP